MREVNNRAEFLAMFDVEGKPKEPFRVHNRANIRLLPADNVTSLVNVELAEYAWLFGLTRVTSLAGVKFAKHVRLYDLTSINTLGDVTFIKDMRLYGLTNITSLDDVKLANDVTLYDLNKVTSLDNVKFAKGVALYGLDKVVVNPVNITEDELTILRQIPIDSLDMEYWHSGCGTTHCLAGWAQVLSGLEPDDDTAYSDGRRLLPSMQWYFFVSTDAVKQYLQSIQK